MMTMISLEDAVRVLEALRHDESYQVDTFACGVYSAMNALRSLPAVDGVVVPREPTDEMVDAAWESDAVDYIGEHKRIVSATDAYKAMIAAAPKGEA